MAAFARFLLPLCVCAFALAGCCANNVCDCQDERADAFYFQFATTGTGSFVPNTELDTVVFKRFALPLNASGQPALIHTKLADYTQYADSLNTAGSFDVVNYLRAAKVRTDTLVLNNNLPFAQSGTRKLNTYLYRIQVRQLGHILRDNPQLFELRNIQLVGSFYGDGCCTCYQNSLKTVDLVNLNTTIGRQVIGTETNKVPVYTTITKN